MKALLILVFVSFVAISCVVSQTSVKPGACSPALPIQVCENECTSDSQCTGTHKCCRTKCGGNVCSEPVTLRTRVNRVKPGYCPNPPTGPWVCSSTCNVDVECRGRGKCCKNRCGALRCTNPVGNPGAPVPSQPSVTLPTRPGAALPTRPGATLPTRPEYAPTPAFPGRRPL